MVSMSNAMRQKTFNFMHYSRRAKCLLFVVFETTRLITTSLALTRALAALNFERKKNGGRKRKTNHKNSLAFTAFILSLAPLGCFVFAFSALRKSYCGFERSCNFAVVVLVLIRLFFSLQ